ncbi:MAG: MCE family protein [Acidobacteria bacterium]|nr:MCE family protein [Acidobacteriota bacterium]
MPSAQRVKWSQLRVGILALVAMAVLAVLIFYLTSGKSVFSKEVTIYTYMGTSAVVPKGAPVRLNGILVGKVGQVELSGDPKPSRTIRFDLMIDEARLRSIPADSNVIIGMESLLGSRFISIRKGTSPTPVAPGGELISGATPELEDIVERGVTTMDTAQAILKRIEKVIELVEVGKGTIGKLLVDEELYRRFNSLLGDMQKVTGALASGQGTIGKLIYDDALYTDIRKTTARIDRLIAELEAGNGTAGKFLKDPAVYDETRKSLAEVRGLLADINAGKGTAGKLLKSDELHASVKASIDSINTLLDGVNKGKGTLGQLVVNQQLYESLNGATHEMQGLMKDFRANPKKFLRIKLGLF